MMGYDEFRGEEEFMNGYDDMGVLGGAYNPQEFEGERFGTVDLVSIIQEDGSLAEGMLPEGVRFHSNHSAVYENVGEEWVAYYFEDDSFKTDAYHISEFSGAGVWGPLDMHNGLRVRYENTAFGDDSTDEPSDQDLKDIDKDKKDYGYGMGEAA